jgi:hypothetical protein
MKDENTEPAFPVINSDHMPEYRGMTLRDWFAGQALAGLCADGNLRIPPDKIWPDAVAEYAYGMADAMMEARKK